MGQWMPPTPPRPVSEHGLPGPGESGTGPLPGQTPVGEEEFVSGLFEESTVAHSTVQVVSRCQQASAALLNMNELQANGEKPWKSGDSASEYISDGYSDEDDDENVQSDTDALL